VTRVVDAIFFLMEQALFAFKAVGAILVLMILAYALVSELR